MLLIIAMGQVHFSFAKTVSVYKNWVTDGQVLTLDERETFVQRYPRCEYVFDKASSSTLKFVTANCDNPAMIKFGNKLFNSDYQRDSDHPKNLYCEVVEKLYEICLTKIEYTHFNQTKGDAEYKFYLDVSKTIAELTVSKSIEKKDLYVQEPTEVTIKITGDADLPATDVTYEEKYTDFILSKPEGCKIINRNHLMIERASINPKDVHECTFQLYGKINTTYASAGEMKYHNGLEKSTYAIGSKSGEKLEIKVVSNEYVVDWDFSEENISNKTFEIGDKIWLYINVTNFHETNSINPTNVLLDFKGGAVIEDLNPDWRFSNNKYKLEKTIEPKANETYSFLVKFTRSGRHSVQYSGFYEIGERIKTINKTQTLEVNMPKTAFFNMTYIKLVQGQTQPVYFTFINPTKHGLSNIRLTLTSDFLNINETFRIDNIHSKGFEDVTFEEIEVPNVSVEKIPITVQAVYSTQYYEKINFSLNFTVPLYSKDGKQIILNVTNTTNQTINSTLENPEELGEDQPEQMMESKKGWVNSHYFIIGILAFVIVVVGVVLLLLYRRIHQRLI